MLKSFSFGFFIKFKKKSSSTKSHSSSWKLGGFSSHSRESSIPSRTASSYDSGMASINLAGLPSGDMDSSLKFKSLPETGY